MNRMCKCCCYCAVAAGSNMVVILVNLRKNTIHFEDGTYKEIRDLQLDITYLIV